MQFLLYTYSPEPNKLYNKCSKTEQSEHAYADPK